MYLTTGRSENKNAQGVYYIFLAPFFWCTQFAAYSPKARNRFNQVVEAKSLKVCSYEEKCAEFKNQTLKKIG